jgi:hypothetical protein
MSDDPKQVLNQFTTWDVLFHLWWKRPMAIITIAGVLTALSIIGGIFAGRINNFLELRDFATKVKYVTTDYPTTKILTNQNADSIKAYGARILYLEAAHRMDSITITILQRRDSLRQRITKDLIETVNSHSKKLYGR